ncbi:MAG: hypothetical protein AAGG47_07180 [Pseudomonadota bacterium]
MRRSRERGAALLIAVSAAMLLASLAIGVQREADLLLRVAQHAQEEVHAGAAAEAGVAHLAVLLAADATDQRAPALGPEDGAAYPKGLSRLRPGVRIVADGRTYGATWEGASLWLSATAEAGKIDLNAAPPALLLALFDKLGVTAPDGLATRLEAARSPSGNRVTAGQKKRAFEAIDEAVDALALSPTAYRRVVPFVTVDSGLAAPEPLLASAEVFEALPLSAASRSVLAEARTAGRGAGRAEGPITLIVRAKTMAGGTAVRQALIVLTPGTSVPLRFLRRAADPGPLAVPRDW